MFEGSLFGLGGRAQGSESSMLSHAEVHGGSGFGNFWFEHSGAPSAILYIVQLGHTKIKRGTSAFF